MEHSNSSNSNPPKNQHTSQEQQNGSSTAPQPSKSIKAKGRFSPKNTAPNSAGQPYDQPGYSQPQAGPYGPPPFVEQPPPPYYGAPPVSEPGGKLKHGGLGIASFILAIISILAIVIGFIVIFSSILNMSEADILMLQDPAYIESMILSAETMPSFIVSVVVGGLLMIASALIAFIGFVLGCISLFIKQRRKVFGIIGTVLNGLLCFGGLIFFLLSFVSTFTV